MYVCAYVTLQRYKSYSVGNFELLPLACTDLILDFCDYHSVVTVRNTCRFLHNHTKRRRAAWLMHPMRTDMYVFGACFVG